MREVITSDVATGCYCPFSLPTEKYCMGEDCLAWENVPGDEGGICLRLSQRYNVQFRNNHPLEVLLVDIPGDSDESEVY